MKLQPEVVLTRLAISVRGAEEQSIYVEACTQPWAERLGAMILGLDPVGIKVKAKESWLAERRSTSTGKRIR
jgi:hypothetical protein